MDKQTYQSTPRRSSPRPIRTGRPPRSGRVSTSTNSTSTSSSSASESRSSPVSLSSTAPNHSPFYAGPKFADPPAPADLPKPPIDWMYKSIGRAADTLTDTNTNASTMVMAGGDKALEMTNLLKMLLKVKVT